MRLLFLSSAIATVTGVIFFFLSVAFFCFVFLLIRAVSHAAPDMTLALKAAASLATVAGIAGFVGTLVRSGRSAVIHR